ncbi:MAG: transglycosylase SLT domain-containing protein [Methylophilaceae bacterium]
MTQHLLPTLLALCLSTPSIAQNLVGAEAALANEAATAKTEEEKLAMQAKAMAHLKAMLSVKKKNAVVKQVSPYEQLVKLAFKGKGTNGINSYQDAAVQFCKQARDDNSAEAQFALGWMYANGKGFSKDENIAAFFYHKAATQDHFRAKKSLIDFTGDASLAKTPECMLPDAPEPMLASNELAPAGSNGKAFYKKGPIFKIVERLAPQYHIETDLAMAFIKVESNFNPKATSPKNAQGLMQLIPATARRFHVKNPYNPEDNIKGGLAYLRWLMAYFEGDVRLVAAAYNAGEGAVDKYKGVPPYPETKKYVTKIYNLYQKSFHPFQSDVPNARTSRIIRLSSNP